MTLRRTDCRLILNADDFGLTADINRAIFHLAHIGAVSSTSLMVNLPLVEESSTLASECPHIGIGVHLNLTTGKPLSPPDRVGMLIDEEGNFLPLSVLVRRGLKGQISMREIEHEVEAQIKRAQQFCQIDYWNAHEGFHRYEPFANVCMAVCRRHAVPAMRSYQHYFFQPDGSVRRSGLKDGLCYFMEEAYYSWLSWRAARHFNQPDGLLSSSSTLETLKSITKQPPSGLWEVFCHPAASIKGLTEMEQRIPRVAEYEFLASADWLAVVADWRVRLVTFRELA